VTKLHQFVTAQDAAPRQASLIQGVIDDMARTVQILSVDIRTEEERVRVFDLSDPKYPILARGLKARRQNLQVTIAFLEKRLYAVTGGRLPVAAA
jgi:hypothetical protein